MPCDGYKNHSSGLMCCEHTGPFYYKGLIDSGASDDVPALSSRMLKSSLSVGTLALGNSVHLASRGYQGVSLAIQLFKCYRVL